MSEELKKIVEHQANMESLWNLYPSVGEHLLQMALRHLHAVIEENEFDAEMAKKVYWNLEEQAQ